MQNGNEMCIYLAGNIINSTDYSFQENECETI